MHPHVENLCICAHVMDYICVRDTSAKIRIVLQKY